MDTTTLFKNDITAARVLVEAGAVPVAVSLRTAYAAFCLTIACAVSFWTGILLCLPFTLFNGESWQILIVPSYVTIWIVWRQLTVFLNWFHGKLHF